MNDNNQNNPLAADSFLNDVKCPGIPKSTRKEVESYTRTFQKFMNGI